MLNNLLPKLSEYVEKHKKLDKDLHDQDAKNAEYYSAGIRIQKLGELKKVYHDSCKILHDEYEKEVSGIFEDAIKQLNAAAMVTVDQGLLNNISMMEHMDKISKQEGMSLHEVTKNNYLANKKVYQLLVKVSASDDMWKRYIDNMGSKDITEKFFIPLDSMIESVESLKEYVMNFFFGNDYKDFSYDNYHVRNLLSGKYIDDVKREVDIFINRYQQ